MPQESDTVQTESYTDNVEKEEIVWENIEGDTVQYDSAGNPMDASRKERFLGEAAGQEEVREIHFTPDIEEKAEMDRIRRERLGEATRDTITDEFDGPSVGFCYEINPDDGSITPQANVHGSSQIEPANVGVEPANGIEPADVGVSQTTAKITMFGESKDVNEPGVDPEQLGENFERKFRQAQRDPFLDPRRDMSKEHKLEKGYEKLHTRGGRGFAVVGLLQLQFLELLDGVITTAQSILNITTWILLIAAVAYLLLHRFLPRVVPDISTVRNHITLPRRIRLLLPNHINSPDWILSGVVLAAGVILLTTGSPRVGTIILVALGAYVLVGQIKSWITKRTWISMADEGEYPLEYQIEKVSDDFDGQVLADVIALDPEGSIGVLGAARSGKTQTMYCIAYQMVQESRRLPERQKTTFVVYDRKDDWKKFLPGDRTIRLAGDNPTHLWNLFREVEEDTDFDVMSRLLFPEAHESGGNDFFPKAARQLFSASCKYLRREFEEQDEGVPSNADLVQFFQRSREEMHEALSTYDDLTAATSAIDPDAEGQAAGVYASVQQEIQDSFVGSFGKSPEEAEKPAFSFREYNEQPDDRYVLLDHQQRLGDAIDNIFRYFIDRSTRLGLEHGSQMSYFILDEFARVPHLRNIGELVSVGPGKNVKTMVALQSKSQLTQNYSNEQANSILAGLLTQIIMRLNDEASIDHAKTITGVRHVSNSPEPMMTKPDSDEPLLSGPLETESPNEVLQEQNDFAGGEFLSFADGESVIKRKDGWARGYMPMLQDQKWKIDKAHGWHQSAEQEQEQRSPEQSDHAPTPTANVATREVTDD
jgi:hypothetical protein